VLLAPLVPARRWPFSREPTALAARDNRKDGFHKELFFPRCEPSVFPVAAGTGRTTRPLGVKPGPGGCGGAPERPRLAGPQRKAQEKAPMTHLYEFPLYETLDDSWDADVRDLIQTTPLVYDADGLPVGYDATQLFGHEAAHLGRRF